MKLLHAADLHLGKRFHDVPLKEDQEHVLKGLLALIEEEAPDAVLLCGDIYDKALPSAEAVDMLDRFLTELAGTGAQVFIIAGNHDSPSRLSYGGGLLARLRIHIAGQLRGLPEVITLSDAFGPVHFVLLPFFRLYEIKALWPDEAEGLDSYEKALELLFRKLALPAGERKVLLSHQHYSYGGLTEISDSETDIIGGLEACDSRVLEGFSYAALGHLHRPQALSKPYIRYAGSPLAYSFSEAGYKKSFPVVELGPGGTPAAIELKEITPLRRVAELKGELEDLLREAPQLPPETREAFLRVTLIDKERLDYPLRRLQTRYPNVLQLRLEREETEASGLSVLEERPEAKDLLSLFSDFYQEQTGHPLADEELKLLGDVWREARQEQEAEDRL